MLCLPCNGHVGSTQYICTHQPHYRYLGQLVRSARARQRVGHRQRRPLISLLSALIRRHRCQVPFPMTIAPRPVDDLDGLLASSHAT